MIVKSIRIEKFRGFKQAEFELGSHITVIAGQNGTQKTTLLGMISQPFSISSAKEHPIAGERPLCGGSYRSGFSEKFKLSESFDKPKSHEWTLELVEGDIEFTVESMPRDSSNPDVIRFWRKGNRSKGSGYIPVPVIYLSLSRLFPIGEDLDLALSDDVVLSKEEIRFYSEWHHKILIIPEEPLISVDYLSSVQKKTVGVNTDYYDWKMNSAGQDNIGKILLAILSFKRLQKQYPDAYKGGLLVIDEIDATLYPASQIKLFDALRKFASQHKIQVIFTTHSLTLLERACHFQDDTKLRNQVQVLFLKKVNNQIKVVPKPSYTFIRSMLNNVLVDKIKPRRFLVFTEDKECKIFCKSLLGHKLTGASFIDCTFGCDSLIELINKGVPGFRETESMTVLDGDVNLSASAMKKIKKHNHILVLPGDASPERVFAEFLFSLPDDAPQWNEVCDDYRKQVAFGDFTIGEIRKDREKAKEWFRSQQSNWGRGCARLINTWKKENGDACDEFVVKFERALKLSS